MAFLDPFKSFLQTLLSTLQSQYYTFVIVALGLLVAGAVTYVWLWAPMLLTSPWFWGVVVMLAVVALFCGIRYGIPKLRERYFLRQEGSASVIAGQESPEEFHARFTKALQTLGSLPQLKGRENPLYVLPWYLLIGEAEAGKTAVVKSADLFSPLLPVTDTATTQNCDWWIANTAVVLDTTGRYVAQTDKARDRAEWYRLLRLLRQHREHEPINGMIIAVAAETLITQPEERLRADASRLRERCEEAVQELGCDFPLYLLITKCDQIEGFREFFSSLPVRVLNEVIGFVNDPPPAIQNGAQPARREETLQRLQTGLRSIYERLHRFRLSLLDSKLSERLRQPVFCFPEEFAALQQSLVAFAKPLLSVDPRYHTPLFRAVFLSSALQQGTSKSFLRQRLQVPETVPSREDGNLHYFLYDLFHSILPRDRGLASLTGRERRRRGFARLFSTSTWLGLGLLLAVFVAQAYRTDRRIVQATDLTQCPESVAQSPARPALAEADRCRVTVQALIDQNHQRSSWSTLWFTRSFTLENELRQRYQQHFQTQVLVPLNAVMEQAALTTDDPFPLLLLVAQRVHLYRQCLSPSGCPPSVADGAQPDYPVMLNPYRDRQPPPEEVTQLKATYGAYLVWQPEGASALQLDLGNDQQRLQRWLSAKQLNLERLLAWVNRRSPPFTYEDYWERPRPVSTLTSPQISPACTKNVWEQYLSPLLQQLQDAAPDISAQLQIFQQQHVTNCFTEWQRFLADFAQGAERWKGGDRQTFVLRILTDESPYQRVLKDAWDNLSPWLPTTGADEALPAWVRQLRLYTNAEQKPIYRETLHKIDTQLKATSLPEASFKLLRESLTEGKPPEEATNPLQRTWLLATQLVQGTGATPTSADGLMWQSLVQEPVRYVSRLLQEQANLHIEKLWAENVLDQVAGLPPAERLVALYGPGGKVEGFTKQVLDPFLQGNLLPGEKMALPIRVAKGVDEGKQLSPPLKSDAAYPVQVRVGRRPTIEGSSPLREEQTVLSIACATKTYRVSNRYEQGPSEVTVPWSYQACGDVSFTVYFYFTEPERRPSRESEKSATAQLPATVPTKRVQLTKRYPGPTGFLRFLRDFTEGTHRFEITEFDPDPEIGAILQEGTNFVNVYYVVSVPPPLAKLTAALEADPSRKTPPDASPFS